MRNYLLMVVLLFGLGITAGCGDLDKPSSGKLQEPTWHISLISYGAVAKSWGGCTHVIYYTKVITFRDSVGREVQVPRDLCVVEEQ